MKEQKVVNPSFAIFFAANNHDNCRFGIATPKKLIKLATDRNFYKRQIKGMLISHLKSEEEKQADGCQTNAEHCHSDLVIIIRYPYLKNDFATNQKNLYKLLGLVDKRKINSEAKDKLSEKNNNI
jgi:ribonuclease P protein component